LLAIVVEFRVFGGGRLRGDWWASGRALEPDETVPVWIELFVVAFGLLFFVGELSALRVVFDGKPSASSDLVVNLTLALGFLQLVVIPVQPYFESLLDRVPLLRRGKLWLWRRRDSPPRADRRDGDNS
jgi:hypothetical protein